MTANFRRTMLELHLLAITPEARTLRSRLENALDDYSPSPTHAAMIIALGDLLRDVLASAPPGCRRSLTDCVVEVLTRRD
jgi:hypothetical protein